MVKNSNWQEANHLDILQAIVAEDLNPGLPSTNPVSGHGGTWTRVLRITSPAI